jgi:hypothetical protein
LSQLKQAGLVEDRRIGKSSLYRLAAPTISHALKGHPSNDLKGHDFSRAVIAINLTRLSLRDGGLIQPSAYPCKSPAGFLRETISSARGTLV